MKKQKRDTDHYKLATKHFRHLTEEQLRFLIIDIQRWLEPILAADIWAKSVLFARNAKRIKCRHGKKFQ